jgi:hypothetical protein
MNTGTTMSRKTKIGSTPKTAGSQKLRRRKIATPICIGNLNQLTAVGIHLRSRRIYSWTCKTPHDRDDPKVSSHLCFPPLSLYRIRLARSSGASRVNIVSGDARVNMAIGCVPAHGRNRKPSERDTPAINLSPEAVRLRFHPLLAGEGEGGGKQGIS